jgi:serine acetyltransferase
MVGANSVVLNDTLVPANALAVGSPAVIKENRARSQDIVFGANNYVQRTERFRRELRRID